jgi:hypothetical protein
MRGLRRRAFLRQHAGVTVPPGLRPPSHEQRGNFETIEVYAPVETVRAVPAVESVEQVDTREERADIAVIGPIAALVLALTISTLVLEHPAARAVAAGLATVGLIVAVVLMLMGKRPQPGKHVARHAIDPDADPDGTERISSNWSGTDRPRH